LWDKWHDARLVAAERPLDTFFSSLISYPPAPRQASWDMPFFFLTTQLWLKSAEKELARPLNLVDAQQWHWIAGLIQKCGCVLNMEPSGVTLAKCSMSSVRQARKVVAPMLGGVVLTVKPHLPSGPLNALDYR